MTVGLSSSVAYKKPGYTTKWQPSEEVAARIAAKKGKVSQTQPVVSEAGNSCTDGKDDGKIGLFSAIGNIFQGAAKAVVNGVKGMFTDSNGNFSILKTLKTVAIGAACVVCPAAGFALGAVGLAAGVVKLGTGVVKALSAKTDAEAKDMWEQVGEGGLTVAASAVGMKASLGAMKAASGAESALAQLKPDATFAQKVTALGKDAVTSTKNNLGKAKNIVSDFFKTKKDLNIAKKELNAAEAKCQEALEAQGGSDVKGIKGTDFEAAGKVKTLDRSKINIQTELDAYNTANQNLQLAQEQYTNNAIGRVLTDTKNTVFHPIKAFKQIRQALNVDSAAATEGAAASTTKFGSLTNAPKVMAGKLTAVGKQIWTKLNDPNTTYSQIVQEYGYTNVAQALEVIAEAQLIDTQI